VQRPFLIKGKFAMPERNSLILRVPHHRLFVGLAAGLCLSIVAAQAAPLPHAASRGSAFPAIGNTLAARFGDKPNHPWAGTTHHVTNCADDATPGSGSLRSIIADATTVSGDSIDFEQLPVMCSTITLGGPAIEIYQDSLYLQGPGAAKLTIDANAASAVFYHYGSGTLYVNDLTISNGAGPNGAGWGGCIYSASNASLVDSIVTNCKATSHNVNTPARGGGIYTRGDLTLIRSTISNNVALTTAGAKTYGGGVYVGGGFFSLGSTISDNTATAPGSTTTMGGGAVVYGDVVSIETSTISGNKAKTGGGLMLLNTVTGSLLNSTVSGNRARYYGGILTNGNLTVTNSTIAFNTSTMTTEASGLYTRNAALTLQNSIVADNVSSGEPSDLGGSPGTQVDGANNLVVSSTLMFSGTSGVCPHLDVLADNGGGTRTHGLRQDSAAIDSGDAGSSTLDQRGVQRPQGVAADIGAFERQSTDKEERLLASGFDGLCDQ
jgi:hypothetical protein